MELEGQNKGSGHNIDNTLFVFAKDVFFRLPALTLGRLRPVLLLVLVIPNVVVNKVVVVPDLYVVVKVVASLRVLIALGSAIKIIVNI